MKLEISLKGQSYSIEVSDNPKDWMANVAEYKKMLLKEKDEDGNYEYVEVAAWNTKGSGETYTTEKKEWKYNETTRKWEYVNVRDADGNIVLETHFKSTTGVRSRANTLEANAKYISGVIDPEWAQFTYEEIIAMETQGVVIPEDVLEWAHSMQQSETDISDLDTDGVGEESGTEANPMDIRELRTSAVEHIAGSMEDEQKIEVALDEFNPLVEDMKKMQHEIDDLMDSVKSELEGLNDEWKALDEKIKNNEQLSPQELERYKALGKELYGKKKNLEAQITEKSGGFAGVASSLNELDKFVKGANEYAEDTSGIGRQLSEYEARHQTSSKAKYTNSYGIIGQIIAASRGRNLAQDAVQVGEEVMSLTDSVQIRLNETASMLDITINSEEPDRQADVEHVGQTEVGGEEEQTDNSEIKYEAPDYQEQLDEMFPAEETLSADEQAPVEDQIPDDVIEETQPEELVEIDEDENLTEAQKARKNLSEKSLLEQGTAFAGMSKGIELENDEATVEMIKLMMKSGEATQKAQDKSEQVQGEALGVKRDYDSLVERFEAAADGNGEPLTKQDKERIISLGQKLKELGVDGQRGLFNLLVQVNAIDNKIDPMSNPLVDKAYDFSKETLDVGGELLEYAAKLYAIAGAAGVFGMSFISAFAVAMASVYETVGLTDTAQAGFTTAAGFINEEAAQVTHKVDEESVKSINESQEVVEEWTLVEAKEVPSQQEAAGETTEEEAIEEAASDTTETGASGEVLETEETMNEEIALENTGTTAPSGELVETEATMEEKELLKEDGEFTASGEKVLPNNTTKLIEADMTDEEKELLEKDSTTTASGEEILPYDTSKLDEMEAKVQESIEDDKEAELAAEKAGLNLDEMNPETQASFMEVFEHENAHKQAAGALAGDIVVEQVGDKFEGHVDIKMPGFEARLNSHSTSAPMSEQVDDGNPEETVDQLETVIDSANAPEDPSGTDSDVAQQAQEAINDLQGGDETGAVDNRSAAQKKREEMSDKFILEQGTAFAGFSLDAKKENDEMAVTVFKAMAESVKAAATAKRRANQIKEVTSGMKSEFDGLVQRFQDAEDGKNAEPLTIKDKERVIELGNQLRELGISGQTDLANLFGCILGMDEAIDNEAPPVAQNARDFSKETIEIGAQILAIGLGLRMVPFVGSLLSAPFFAIGAVDVVSSGLAATSATATDASVELAHKVDEEALGFVEEAQDTVEDSTLVGREVAPTPEEAQEGEETSENEPVPSENTAETTTASGEVVPAEAPADNEASEALEANSTTTASGEVVAPEGADIEEGAAGPTFDTSKLDNIEEKMNASIEEEKEMGSMAQEAGFSADGNTESTPGAAGGSNSSGGGMGTLADIANVQSQTKDQNKVAANRGKSTERLNKDDKTLAAEIERARRENEKAQKEMEKLEKDSEKKDAQRDEVASEAEAMQNEIMAAMERGEEAPEDKTAEFAAKMDGLNTQIEGNSGKINTLQNKSERLTKQINKKMEIQAKRIEAEKKDVEAEKSTAEKVADVFNQIDKAMGITSMVGTALEIVGMIMEKIVMPPWVSIAGAVMHIAGTILKNIGTWGGVACKVGNAACQFTMGNNMAGAMALVSAGVTVAAAVIPIGGSASDGISNAKQIISAGGTGNLMAEAGSAAGNAAAQAAEAAASSGMANLGQEAITAAGDAAFASAFETTAKETLKGVTASGMTLAKSGLQLATSAGTMIAPEIAKADEKKKQKAEEEKKKREKNQRIAANREGYFSSSGTAAGRRINRQNNQYRNKVAATTGGSGGGSAGQQQRR